MKVNKLISVILCIAMVFSTMSFTAFAAEGTEESAVPALEISDVDGLIEFSKTVNAGETFAGKTVVLTQDIELGENEYWYYNDGTSEVVDHRIIKEFAGIFDGKGFAIEGLKFVNKVNNQNPYMYLFNTITTDGAVQNLTLNGVDADINGYDYFGFIAYTLNGTATKCHVKNVNVYVDVAANGNGYIASSGSMFGKMASATVTGCTAETVNITCLGDDNTDCAGGLIGVSGGTEDAYNTITDCSVTDITFDCTRKTKRLGGFVGQSYYTNISNCTATNVNISVDTYYQSIGGFVGNASTSSAFKNCKVVGFTLEGNTSDYAGDVGGFAGYTNSSNADAVEFTGCSVANLDMNLSCSDNNEWVAGGFIGYPNSNVDVDSCNVSGTIDVSGTGTDHTVGGFIGTLDWTSNKKINVSDSSANTDINTFANAGGFVGDASSSSKNNTFGADSNTASGNVTSTSGVAGGFVGTGDNGIYTNCEATGAVSAPIINIPVASIDSTVYYSLAVALTDAKTMTGDVTITLTEDMDLSAYTSVDMADAKCTSLTIDGDGKVIKNLAQPLMVEMTKSNPLTVKNIIFKDIALQSSETNGLTGSGVILPATLGGHKITIENVIVDGGTITSNSENDFVGGFIGYFQGVGTGELTIKDSEVVGVTIESPGGAVGSLVGHADSAEVTVTNTKINGNTLTTIEAGACRADKIGLAIGSNLGSDIFIDVTIETASKTKDGDEIGKLFGRMNSGASLTLTNGTYLSNPTVSGKEKSSLNEIYEHGMTDEEKADISLLDKYDIVQTPDGKYSVQVVDGVVKIGDTQYVTIQEAIDEAEADSEIILIKDADETGIKVAADKQITLNLNGNTLTGDILSEGDLTVKNGEIVNNNFVSCIESKGVAANLNLEDVIATSTRHALRIEGGSATINGGTYSTLSQGGEQSTHALNAGGDYATKVIINDGNFNGIRASALVTTADSGAAVNAQENAQVTINGGNFAGGQNDTLATSADGKIIVNGGSYDQDPSDYVSEGLKVGNVSGGSYWKVINDSRKMILVADKDEVLAGEKVDVEVVLEGEELQGIEYVLTYDTELFTYVPDSNSKYIADDVDEENGRITYKKFMTGGVFDPISTIGKWTFIANDVEFKEGKIEAEFNLVENLAWKTAEGHYGIKYPTDVVKDTVEFKFNEYGISFEVNGVAQTSNEKTVSYIEEGYNVELIADPALTDANGLIKTITDMNGNICNELREMGTYTITFTTENAAPGYKNINETFILTIEEPEKFVEVNLTGGYFSDYTVGKKLVLVHTNEAGVSFEYDGIPMVDVSSAGYKYYNTDRKYDKVFAIVVDYIFDEALLKDYEAKVEAVNGESAYKIDDEYDTNINYYSTYLSTVVDGTDVTSIYSVLNQTNFSGDANPFGVSYAEDAKVFMDKMMIALKSDVKKDKIIDGNDTARVVTSAYPR